MAPLTSRQRQQLNQFMEITGAGETVAKTVSISYYFSCARFGLERQVRYIH